VNRAGKGMMLTAYDRPAATGKQLDMQETIAQLESALATAKALAASAQSAKAESADTGAQQQVKDDLDGLKKPGLLMSTPASAAVVAGGGVQFSAQENINAVAGKNADWSMLKRFTVAAGEVISLFAQKLGIKIFAAKGPVEVQAQGGPMSLIADKDLTVSSVNGTVRIVAKNELTLESGGGFIQMKDGSITLGGPLDLFIKTITVQTQGKATLNMPLDLNHPALAGMPTTPLTIYVAASPASRAAIPAGMPYKLFAAGGLVKQGVFDETGSLQVDHHPTTQQYTLELASGIKHTIPVAKAYRGDATNGVLANQGFHFHESQASGDINPPGDRALNRQRYNNVLNPETEQ
jgi:type VI secretion system secreted protein VgrG